MITRCHDTLTVAAQSSRPDMQSVNGDVTKGPQTKLQSIPRRSMCCRASGRWGVCFLSSHCGYTLRLSSNSSVFVLLTLLHNWSNCVSHHLPRRWESRGKSVQGGRGGRMKRREEEFRVMKNRNFGGTLRMQQRDSCPRPFRVSTQFAVAQLRKKTNRAKKKPFHKWV